LKVNKNKNKMKLKSIIFISDIIYHQKQFGSNASLIMQIYLAIHEILTNKVFIVTDDLISWFFVVAFVHLAYVQIALI